MTVDPEDVRDCGGYPGLIDVTAFGDVEPQYVSACCGDPGDCQECGS